MKLNKNVAVIVAAGKSKRFGGKTPKVFAKIPNTKKIVVEETILTLTKSNCFDYFVIVTDKSYFEIFHKIIVKNKNLDIERFAFVEGGKERKDSVYNGLKAASEIGYKFNLVAIHDAARPFVSTELIKKLIKAANETGASVPVLTITDSVKKMIKGKIVESLNREEIVRVQTPQVFKFSKIIKMFEKYPKNLETTDDIAIANYFGLKARAVIGEESNIKITFQSDLKKLK